MLLVILGLLWIATIAAGVALLGVRPRTGAAQDRPWPWWTWPAAGLSVVLLVVVIPAVSILESRGDIGRASNTGVVLDDRQARGREIFQTWCKKCHTLADAAAVSTIGPNLDALQPSRATIVDAILNGRARGNGQMPAHLVSEDDAQAVADYLTAVAGRDR